MTENDDIPCYGTQFFSQAWPGGTWLCSVSTGFFVNRKKWIFGWVSLMTHSQTDRLWKIELLSTQLLRSRGWRALVTQMIGLGLIKVKHSKENSVFEIKCYLGRIKAAQWIWWWPWWRWWQATIFLWIQIQTFRLFNNKTVSSGVLCKEAAIKWGGCWVVINWHFWTLNTTNVGKNGENYKGIGVKD